MFSDLPSFLHDSLRGQALALYYLGVSFVTLMVTELDPDCFELLKIVHHAINDPITFWNYDPDMAKRRQVADVDLYLGTSPCQDFSNAGQGRGLHWPFKCVYLVPSLRVCLQEQKVQTANFGMCRQRRSCLSVRF